MKEKSLDVQRRRGKNIDFSILDAFLPDDFENVVHMNKEWLEHHEDTEYDHGTAMYWFADFDRELECV